MGFSVPILFAPPLLLNLRQANAHADTLFATLGIAGRNSLKEFRRSLKVVQAWTLVALGVGAAFVYSSYNVLFTPEQTEYFMDVAMFPLSFCWALPRLLRRSRQRGDQKETLGAFGQSGSRNKGRVQRHCLLTRLGKETFYWLKKLGKRFQQMES